MTGRPVALVTGAARGIGRAAALALAAAGYDVAVNYSVSEGAAGRVAAQARELGAEAIAVRADVADEAAVTAMVAGVGGHFGRLDALVNNAGMTIDVPPSDLDGLDLADWDRVFAVNVRGMFCVTRACVPLLRAAAVPVRGLEGGGGEPDPDPGRGARPGHPGQCGSTRLDGGRLDAGPAGRQLRAADGAAGADDTAGPLCHRRGRGGHRRLARGVESIRHG
jgi:NAD(P)-dependent dehydrogenase (short-subunit alcohol dehydrogenase family)